MFDFTNNFIARLREEGVNRNNVETISKLCQNESISMYIREEIVL